MSYSESQVSLAKHLPCQKCYPSYTGSYLNPIQKLLDGCSNLRDIKFLIFNPSRELHNEPLNWQLTFFFCDVTEVLQYYMKPASRKKCNDSDVALFSRIFQTLLEVKKENATPITNSKGTLLAIRVSVLVQPHDVCTLLSPS